MKKTFFKKSDKDFGRFCIFDTEGQLVKLIQLNMY